MTETWPEWTGCGLSRTRPGRSEVFRFCLATGTVVYIDTCARCPVPSLLALLAAAEELPTVEDIRAGKEWPLSFVCDARELANAARAAVNAAKGTPDGKA